MGWKPLILTGLAEVMLVKNLETEMVRSEWSPERSLHALPSSSHLAPTMTDAWWVVLGHVPGSWPIPTVVFDDDSEPLCLDELLMIGGGLR